MQTSCTHSRTELIARRDGVDYVRCLDCDQVFEADDLESSPAATDEEEQAG
jgi:hypothetical protein